MSRPYRLPYDDHVATTLRSLRMRRGLSQKELAEMAGISMQQICKYEKHHNRISAGRLWQFAELLRVPIDSFFENMPKKTVAQSS